MTSTEQIISCYETVSDLTGKMLDAAKARNWEKLVELESQCARQVQTLREGESALRLSGDTRTKKIRIIHKILADDREIRNITTPWMAELAALISNVGVERKLSMAYGG